MVKIQNIDYFSTHANFGYRNRIFAKIHALNTETGEDANMEKFVQTMNEKLDHFREQSRQKRPRCFGSYERGDSLCKENNCAQFSSCVVNTMKEEGNANKILKDIAKRRAWRRQFRLDCTRESAQIPDTLDAVLACR